MSGSSGAALDSRRKKLLFRSWHRGIREMDLIMGRFADAAIAGLSEPELDELESLIEVPDHDLFGWISGEAEVPQRYDTALFRRLKAFHQDGPAGA